MSTPDHHVILLWSGNHDRREQSLRILRHYQTTPQSHDRFQIHVVKCPLQEDWKKGCFQAHQKGLRYFLRHQWDHVIIVEDNLEKTRNGRYRFLQQAYQQVQNRAPLYDLMFLARFPNPFLPLSRQVAPSLYRCYGQIQGSTSYLISRQGAVHLTKVPYRNIPYDIEMLFPPLQTYYMYPSLFQRSGEINSHISSELNIPRRLYFFPPMYRFLEWLEYHQIIFLLFLFIMVLLVWQFCKTGNPIK